MAVGYERFTVALLIAVLLPGLAAAQTPQAGPAADLSSKSLSSDVEARGVEVHVRLVHGGRLAYRVAGNSVANRKLTDVIRKGLDRLNYKIVTIVAPSSVSFSKLVWAIDRAKDAGALKIVLDRNDPLPVTPN